MCCNSCKLFEHTAKQLINNSLQFGDIISLPMRMFKRYYHIIQVFTTWTYCRNHEPYCWCKKSCTSWYGKYPIIFWVFMHPRWCRLSSINSISFLGRTTSPCPTHQPRALWITAAQRTSVPDVLQPGNKALEFYHLYFSPKWIQHINFTPRFSKTCLNHMKALY